MKNKTFLLIAILTTFIVFLFQSYSIIKYRSQSEEHQQITTLIQKITYPSEQNFQRIIANKKIILTFTAKYNNLGTIAILFNNYQKINSDWIWFRIKEINTNNWYYQNKYYTGKFDSGFNFTFGFPVIADSQNKEYLIEIESLYGTTQNSVSLHSGLKNYLAKYSYPRSYLTKNPNQILPLLSNKIKTCLDYIRLTDIKKIIINSFLFFLTFLATLHLLRHFKYIDYLKKNLKQSFQVIKKYCHSSNLVIELFFVLTPTILFTDFALFSPAIDKNQLKLFSRILIYFLNLIYLYLLARILPWLRKNFTKYLTQPILIPVFLFIILRLFFLDSIPRWNSAVYFSALINSISKFNFTFASLLQFNWFGHPSMGFGLFSAIFQLLDPTNINMMNVGNIVMGVIAILAFYSICQYFFEKQRQKEIIILTSIFAFNSLFFSISTAFVPDFGVLVFFLAAIALFFRKKYLLSSYFFLLLIFSKETGILCFTLFAFFYFIYTLFKPFSKLFHYSLNLLAISLPAIIYISYWILSKGELWEGNGKNPLTISNNCIFCFSFQPFHFFQNLSVIFVLNFSWIFSIFIITFLIKSIFFKISSFKINDSYIRNMFRSLVFVFIGFVAFFMSYVIYVIPAYMLTSIIFLTLLFYYSLVGLIQSPIKRSYVLIIILILFLVQNFYHIDFLSSKVFGTYYFGNYQVLKIGTEYTGDASIYNTQYLYIDRLINKFNHDFNITNKDNIIINSPEWANFYLGWGSYALYIDQNSHKKTFSQSHSFRPTLYTLTNDQTFPPTAYYLAFPWLENEIDSLDKISKIYKIDKKTKIEINGYWLNVYNLSKK